MQNYRKFYCDSLTHWSYSAPNSRKLFQQYAGDNLLDFRYRSSFY